MRRAALIALFAAGVALLLGALVWILRLGLGLEAAEIEARRHAVQEERARLALWRMDSALATFLAGENARPVDPPAGAAPVDPPFLDRRFEIGAEGAARLRPLAASGSRAQTPQRGGEPEAAGLPRPDRLLALLGQPPLAAPIEAATLPPAIASASAATASAARRGAAGATEPTVVAKATPPAAENEPTPPKAMDPIVERETANQSQLNVAEYIKRQKIADSQANFAQEAPPTGSVPGSQKVPAAPPPAEPPRVSPPPEVAEPAENPPPAVATVPVAAPSSPSRSAPARRRPPGPTGVVHALEPVWIDGRLLLVRRVVRDGAEGLQGLVLDAGATRKWLLDEVSDLLPAADLEPVAPAEAADPGRRLALLPWRLVPGPAPEVEAAGLSPVRLGLALASAAILLAAGAATAALVAGLRLARRRTEFASAVIHELRTPLTTFRLYTDLLAERMVPAEEQPRYLETLRTEADRLGDLLENVLAFTRLERRGAPAAQRIALGPTLREIVERLAPRAAAEGFELKLEVAPEAEAIEVGVDPTALERIVRNLFDNSCRYGRNDAAPRIEVRALTRGRHAVVRWRDHGPGISRKARRRLFRPFRRTDPEQAAAGGVGLGLALSRQLARRFGGDLRLADESGAEGAGGATFELWLEQAG